MRSCLHTSCRQFQSTHPVRGATIMQGNISGYDKFQSTHPVRGATYVERGHVGVANISIHAPREGCDHLSAAYYPIFDEFQSTHPVRGATLGQDGRIAAGGHFNPRTP